MMIVFWIVHLIKWWVSGTVMLDSYWDSQRTSGSRGQRWYFPTLRCWVRCKGTQVAGVCWSSLMIEQSFSGTSIMFLGLNSRKNGSNSSNMPKNHNRLMMQAMFRISKSQVMHVHSRFQDAWAKKRGLQVKHKTKQKPKRLPQMAFFFQRLI